MYQASAENWGDSRFVVTTRHSSLVMDTQGKGANPVDALLGSLCSCMGHYVHDHFLAKGTPLSTFCISADCDTPRDASKIQAILVRIDLGPLRLAQAEQAALLADIAKCKVFGTLRQACQVHVTVVNGGAEAGTGQAGTDDKVSCCGGAPTGAR